MVTLYGLDFVAPRVPTIAVHLEGNMTRNRSLTKGADKGLTSAVEGPFGGRRAEEPTPYPRQI